MIIFIVDIKKDVTSLESGVESKVDKVELEVFNTQKNVEYKAIKERF